MNLALGNSLATQRIGGGDTSPGGSSSVLLLADAASGLLLADGTSFLLLTV